MNPVFEFIKAARPINLLIIIITMLCMRYFVEGGLISHYSEGNPNGVGIFQFERLDNFSFGIATLIMVLLAASGNLINDYFDVKVDRINKPQRIRIGKTVKRRVAMVGHHFINVLAVLLGLYLGWKEHSLFYAITPPAISLTLWFYSFYLKKTFILGNVVVALVICLVPIWAVYPSFIQSMHLPTLVAENLASLPSIMLFYIIIILTYTGQAYMISLFREVVKDAEDVKGDAAYGYRTLPIVWGLKRTRNILCVFMLMWSAVLFGIGYWILTENISNRAHVFFGIVIIPFLISIVSLLKKNPTRKDFKRSSLWLKMTMVGGLVYSITLHHLMGFIIYYFS